MRLNDKDNIEYDRIKNDYELLIKSNICQIK